jgi:hypothetical protein
LNKFNNLNNFVEYYNYFELFKDKEIIYVFINLEIESIKLLLKILFKFL